MLTIIRAWLAAGKPLPAGHRSIPSLEDYDLIRGALLWFDQADPADTQKALFETDTRQEKRYVLLNALFERFGCMPFCARDVGPDEALAPVLGDFAYDTASTGLYLKSHAETLVGGLILTDSGKEKDAPRATLWKIREIGESSAEL